MTRQLIVGNWKMNGHLAQAGRIAEDLAAAAPPTRELAVCPPFTAIHAVADRLAGRDIALGGQDCHPEPSGAHTGDIGAPMLADLGCRYVIVGHSERRHAHGETSARVAAKAEAALDAGMVPIVCVGETQADYDAGRTLSVLNVQLDASLPAAGAGEVVLAYEPVWAIGTGRAATSDDIERAHAALRARFANRIGSDAGSVRIVYGGSVKPANAGDILSLRDVDGALVGGASLDPESFLAIARAGQV